LYKYSEKSLEKIRQLHKDLQVVLMEAIKHVDINIVCGHRDKVEQDKAYAEGNSKLKFPRSKHNKLPVEAVDIIPYPTGYPKDYKGWSQFAYMIGIIKGLSEEMYKSGKISKRLRFGFDFNRDNVLFNDNFIDAPHIELED
jgi:peptidoglycan LD-endopeptidase CwlK